MSLLLLYKKKMKKNIETLNNKIASWELLLKK